MTCGIDPGRGVNRHWGVSDGSDGAVPPGRNCFLLMGEALQSIIHEGECSTMDQDIADMWEDETAGKVADSKKETWDESSEELGEDSELTDLDSDA